MGSSYNKSPRDLSQLTENDLEFLANNTNFSREEIIEWHAGFYRDYKSGRMSKREFKTFYEQFQPGNNNATSNSFCENIFRVFDQDSNGYIDFQEMLFSISLYSSELDTRRKLEIIFKIYDIDGNGKISKKEFKKILKSIYMLVSGGDGSKKWKKLSNPNKDELENLFNKIDVDKNKFITLQEFVDCCMKDNNMLKLIAPNT